MLPGDGQEDEDEVEEVGISTGWILIILLAVNAAGVLLYCFYKYVRRRAFFSRWNSTRGPKQLKVKFSSGNQLGHLT